VPELPEVETVRRGLQRWVAGAVVERVEITGRRSVRRHASTDELRVALTGRSLAGFGRRGKYLVATLGAGPDGDPGGDPVDGAARLVIHLRMSGQLRLAASTDVPRAAHTHVVLGLTDGRELRFVDPRTFGELFVTGPELPELATLGIDALDPALDGAALGALLRPRRARLKPLLMDQRVIAGIGNIYSDEILWVAGLRGSRPGASLRPVELRRLHAAVGEVLGAAVAAGGSSLADATYVDLLGQPGGYQHHHRVYARAGQPCDRCGRPLERSVVTQRSHYWCRRCQR